MASGNTARRHAQDGFTYLAALLLIAISAAALASVAEAWSHARQREKEAQLLWVGNQFKQAIGVYYQRSPGSVKRYPANLDDLVEDRRFATVQRYLRRIYLDPMTGKAEWEVIGAPGGGVMGVKSRAAAGGSTTNAPRTFVYTPTDGK